MYPAAPELADTDDDENVVAPSPTRTSQPQNRRNAATPTHPTTQRARRGKFPFRAPTSTSTNQGTCHSNRPLGRRQTPNS